MSYHNELLKALSKDLATSGLVAFRENGQYTASERGIVAHELPHNPTEAVAVSWYNETEVPTYRRDRVTLQTYVQIRSRFLQPETGADLREWVRARYHRKTVSLTPFLLAGRLLSASPFAWDANRAYTFSINLTLTGEISVHS